MESQLDIHIARIAHVTLVMHLEAVLRGEIPPGQELPSPTRCELGLWLAQREEEVVQRDLHHHALVRHHDAFHRTADRVVARLQATPLSGMAEEVAQLQFLSREIVFLLTAIELEYLNEQHRSEWLAHPLKSLIRRLFEGEHLVLSGEEDILDISHARLLHLRWLNDLFMAFRHHGHHTPPDTEESCSLGVWIQNVGLTKLKHVREMAILDAVHQQFHALAIQTVKRLHRRQDALADQSYADMQTTSREILYLLSVIESKLLEHAAIRQTRHFLR